MMLLSVVMMLACDSSVDLKDSDTSSTTTDPNPVDVPKLFVNEFMSANATTLADEAGEFDDWVEIYNGDDTIVQLEGLYLTDKLDEPTQWAFPAGEGIGPGDYLVIWCDGSMDQGPMHTSFKLNKGGDALILFKVEGGHDPARVDGVEWTSEQPDLAAARVPDGSKNWVHQAGTPNASNG